MGLRLSLSAEDRDSSAAQQQQRLKSGRWLFQSRTAPRPVHTHDVPPPPPPPDDNDVDDSVKPRAKSMMAASAVRAESLVMAPAPVPTWVSPTNRSLSVDAVFVDYTVVPLLLRSGMPYADANGFGEALQQGHRTQPQVRQMLASPEALIAALKDEGVSLPSDEESFIERLARDRFWEETHLDVGPGPGNKRKSFVYFRGGGGSDKSMLPASAATVPRERHRSQFAATRVVVARETAADDLLTDAELERLANMARAKEMKKASNAFV